MHKHGWDGVLHGLAWDKTTMKAGIRGLWAANAIVGGPRYKGESAAYVKLG